MPVVITIEDNLGSFKDRFKSARKAVTQITELIPEFQKIVLETGLWPDVCIKVTGHTNKTIWVEAALMPNKFYDKKQNKIEAHFLMNALFSTSLSKYKYKLVTAPFLYSLERIPPSSRRVQNYGNQRPNKPATFYGHKNIRV